MNNETLKSIYQARGTFFVLLAKELQEWKIDSLKKNKRKLTLLLEH